MANLLEPITGRLRLRQWRPEDREPFARMNADPRVMEFFPSPLTTEQSNAMVDRCTEFMDRNGWGFWAAELLGHGTFIGFVGLNNPTAPLPFAPCTEVGWRLAFDYWGKGLATEAAREALRIGFEILGLEEIVSFTAVTNRRSRAVMERLGMSDSGLFEHPAVPVGNPLRRHCLYRLRATRRCAANP